MDKLHKQSSLSDVERMYRYNSLEEEASLVYELVMSSFEYFKIEDISAIDDIIDEAENNCEIVESLASKDEEIQKLLKEIKNSLTEKQYSKIENLCDALSECSHDLSYL